MPLLPILLMVAGSDSCGTTLMVNLEILVQAHGGCSLSAPNPKEAGGGYPFPPPLQTPKWLYRTMGFAGATDAGVLGIRRGEIFLFDPICLYSKYPEFCGDFKNG